MNVTAATICAATQTGPVKPNGKIGFQITATAAKTIVHHHCPACQANQATITARIATRKRMTSTPNPSVNRGETKSAIAASRPGASALRCICGAEEVM